MGTLTDHFERLASEVSDQHDERADFVNRVFNDTRKFLVRAHEEHMKMANELRETFKEHEKDRMEHETDRMEQEKARMKEVRSMKENLDQAVAELKANVASLRNDFREDYQKGAQILHDTFRALARKRRD